MSAVALQSMPLGPFARPSARMRGGILISKQIQKDNENGENGLLLEDIGRISGPLVTQIVITV